VNEATFVGLDLGTSGLKGVVMSAEGAMLATATAGYPTYRPRPGRAEQDPDDWWEAVGAVVAALTSSVAADRWSALGLSAMIPTLVLADRAGKPIGNAVTWEDDRADPEGERFREAAGADALYTATGQWVDGRYLLPMVRRIRRQEPDRAAELAWIQGAKDHLFRRLTGVDATDPSTATGVGCYSVARGAWDPELAADDVGRLPPVRPATDMEPLRAEVAAALGLPGGLPVALGAADSVCGALGIGATAAGARASLWGTSTVILGVSDEPVRDPAHRYLVTPLALGSRWGLEMDLLSTGSAVAWLAQLGGVTEDEVFDLAAASRAGANGVSFLPYLGFGEQGALWDASLRGTVHGLTLATGRGDLARALLEGVALEVRRCLEVLDEAGLPRGPMSIAGGAASSPAFAGMLAGATGRSVTAHDEGRWASARGAAIVAAASTDAIDTDALAPFAGRTTDPSPGDARTWDDLARRHERLLAAVRARPDRD
jgi:sugar (pentulose or hexulose) kinase